MAVRGLDQYVAQGFSAPFSDLSSDRFSALVVLGGAQSAYETQKYPFLQREMDLCKSFVEANKPIAGFCLGAQILAVALGGEVVAGKQKEIGWFDLTLRNEATSDPLMKDHPQTLLSYHFHGDIIRHVPGSTILASSARTECQLFRHGATAYGFQYHAEVNRSLLEEMCLNNRDYLATNGIDAQTLVDESGAKLPRFEQECAAVLERWLDLFSCAPSVR
jgi:GMP synthase (glutamine-hydrolysing)